MKPLIDDIPIVGGIQLFFLKPPFLDFDLGGVASILDLPGLNGMLKDAIHEQIALNLILPNKVAIVLTDKVSKNIKFWILKIYNCCTLLKH